mmetsp:Transcript_17803/g.29435  ORF Transcript_17803/g.29435 Transcript_17803/m.29435 type:complete len:120 (+) Transcript_17803:39-398(+)
MLIDDSLRVDWNKMYDTPKNCSVQNPVFENSPASLLILYNQTLKPQAFVAEVLHEIFVLKLFHYRPDQPDGLMDSDGLCAQPKIIPPLYLLASAESFCGRTSSAAKQLQPPLLLVATDC